MFSVLRAALEFVSYANWVNPSRIDVNHYMAAAVDNKNSYMTRVDDPKHSVVSCVIPAIISGSNITTRIRKTSANNNVYYFKRIYAVAFRQEYELMVGKLGMIFRFDSISGDYIPPQTGFVTRPAWPARDSNRGKFGGKSKRCCRSSFLTHCLESKLNLLRAASTGAKSNVEDESDLGLTGDDIGTIFLSHCYPFDRPSSCIRCTLCSRFPLGQVPHRFERVASLRWRNPAFSHSFDRFQPGCVPERQF